VAAACFALLSAGRATQGLFANAEHFVVLCAVAGWVLLPQALASGHRRRLLWVGGLLGLGILMKQHGALFAAGALAYAVLAGGQVRNGGRKMAWVAVGVAIPLALTAGALAIAGSFERCWFWTVVYARRYAADVTAHDAIELFKLGAGDVVGSMPLIWILAGLGLVALVWNRPLRGARTFVGLFALSAGLAVVPGFFFRAHYFLLVLPAVALLAGLGVGSLIDLPIASIRKPVRVRIAVAVAILCWAGSFVRSRAYLLEMDPTAVSRATFGLNAFPESIAIADYIRRHTADGDRIAILGSEPQIYFYARRRSATPYVYTYEMMRPHERAARMQEEMAREIENVSPKFLLFVRIEDSWSRENESPNFLFDWFDAYAQERYERVGLVTITPERTQYHWAPDVPWPPDTHYWVLVLQRKS
jgi:4-amino-4-deoxy-L-arabinose transferase-like glycosyltransferase